MPVPTPASSPSAVVPEVLDALSRAETKQDVRTILQRYDSEAVNLAWKQLSPVQRGALQLVRFTNGRIFHELNNTD